MKLPSGKSVNKNTPIYPGSNFTWGEATENCTRHIQKLTINNKTIIKPLEIERKIIATAKELDIVRVQLGNRPIWVNSWYRPARVNRAVGGSVWSRHQFGDAVDIHSNYHSPQAIYRFLDKLHVDGGMSRYFDFVHIDWRGTKARWQG